jgi:hypothetical protein
MRKEDVLWAAGVVLVAGALAYAEGFLGATVEDLKRYWQKRGER